MIRNDGLSEPVRRSVMNFVGYDYKNEKVDENGH